MHTCEHVLLRPEILGHITEPKCSHVRIGKILLLFRQHRLPTLAVASLYMYSNESITMEEENRSANQYALKL